MGKGKRVQKNEITAGTAVKAIITGYISYGILLGFAVFMTAFVVSWCVRQMPSVNHRILSITLSLIGIIFLYFIIHGVCKISVYDVFKKCKMKSEIIETVHTRLNLFVLICVAISVVLVVSTLTMTFNEQKKAIFIAEYQYNQIHSQEFSSELTSEMMKSFEEQKLNTIIATIIFELGLAGTLFSLIPYQKKMIERYNQV